MALLVCEKWQLKSDYCYCLDYSLSHTCPRWRCICTFRARSHRYIIFNGKVFNYVDDRNILHDGPSSRMAFGLVSILGETQRRLRVFFILKLQNVTQQWFAVINKSDKIHSRWHRIDLTLGSI